MGVVKIKLNTWNRRGNRDTKFKRGVAPREGFIDIDHKTKKVHLKAGSFKWKDWDTSISRYNDQGYIDNKKELYSGLCFESRKQAKSFMAKHEVELNTIAQANPLFDHWSVMYVNKRFEPTNKVMYGKDILED